MLVEFFLEKEVSPMVLKAVHQPDLPDEVEIVLGTFLAVNEAMSAMTVVSDVLQSRNWGSTTIEAVLGFGQTAALQCPGNLGLPRRGEVDEPVPRSRENET